VIENASDPYWISLMCGGTQAAKSLGVSLKWYSTTDLTDSTMQTNFNSALLTKPDGLIVNPFTPGLLASQVKSLMAKGTPVTTGDTPITPATEYQLVTNSANVAPFLPAILKSAGTTGTVLILQGSTNPIAVARIKPVVSYIKAHAPGLKILPITYDNFDVNKAATITAAALVAHSDLKLIYAPSGPQGQGAASAVQAAHKAGKVALYAFGAAPAEVAALKSGSIQGLIGQGANVIGGQEVKSLVSYIRAHPNGGPVPKAAKPVLQIPLKLLTKSNVSAPQNAGYLFKSTCSS
jgi:ABC-type sugar transport system substrate-binding protein